MRNPAFSLLKRKAQISCVVTAQLISAFVFTALFVSDLLGNTEDRFFNDAAHLAFEHVDFNLFALNFINEIAL